MARKIGSMAIAITILAFLIGGFSFVLSNFDSSVGVSTSLTSDLSSVDSSLANVTEFNRQYSEQMDNASELAPVTSDQALVLLEKRGSSTGGVANLFSKNILVRFYNVLSAKFSIPSVVNIFVLSLLGTIITILFVRFFFGEGKV